MVDSEENYKFGLGVKVLKELVQSLIAWLQGPNQQKEKQNIFGCQPFWVCKRLMKHKTIQIEKSTDNISKPKQSTDLCSPRVPYSTGCHMAQDAIWHSMPLHAYYLFIFSEIFTTKGSLKDLHIEGIKSWPPPIQDLVYHPSNFWNFLSLYCFGSGDMSQQSMLWELQFRL